MVNDFGTILKFDILSLKVLGKEMVAVLDSCANRSFFGQDCKELVKELVLRTFSAYGSVSTAVNTKHFVCLPIDFRGRSETIFY